MSNPCRKCDHVQDVAAGNAPPRPEFRQPTMYDHLDSFSKFKEAKAHAEELKVTKEELLKVNRKFTDLNMDGMEEEVLDTDIAKLRSNLKKEGYSYIPKENPEPQHELKPVASLTTISRTPVFCPVSKCGQSIGVTSVLLHFLRDHTEDLAVECRNVYSGGRSILLFHRDMFNFGENVCLGVLCYGGNEEVLDSRPGAREICKHNSFLSKSYAHLKDHLPILVMVCRISMDAMLEDKQMATALMDPENKLKQVLVIWMVSVQTTKPIHCTITAFDQAMTSSRSSIVRVRSIAEAQDPRDFLRNDTNYLMMNLGELDILSENGTKPVHVEIKVHEFEA